MFITLFMQKKNETGRGIVNKGLRNRFGLCSKRYAKEIEMNSEIHVIHDWNGP